MNILSALIGAMKYVTGVTEVHTRASQAWDARAGVCQDLVHLSLGALRSGGIPARYISGYVVPKHDMPVGVAQVVESHAWLQYWDGVWISYDPTSGTEPAEHHVEVAIARDYATWPRSRASTPAAAPLTCSSKWK